MRTGNDGTVPELCYGWSLVFTGLITSLYGRVYKAQEVGKKVPEMFQPAIRQSGGSDDWGHICSRD